MQSERGVKLAKTQASYDPVVENIELKKKYREKKDEWDEEKNKLEEKMQKLSSQLDTIKGRMNRLNSSSKEKVSQIAGLNRQSADGLRKLETIHEIHDEGAAGGVLEQVAQETSMNLDVQRNSSGSRTHNPWDTASKEFKDPFARRSINNDMEGVMRM